jgi:hypothetical protein
MSTLDLFVNVIGAAALSILGFALVSAGRNKHVAELARLRSAANAQFLAHMVESGDPKFRFDGKSATVISETESVQSDDDGIAFAMTRFATNSAGEYFMFISNPGAKPYFKHVEHRMARVTLKHLYVPPTTDS